MAMALEGIRVIDLTRLAPGPYCTMFLADLGADVIKIEPGGGRAAIALFPQTAVEGERMRAYNAEGRNKRSIVMNLKMREAREVFYKLAAKADVIIEEFRPGVVKRLGVDYETIRKINPRIVYCSLTGYGQDGPYEQVAGHDINYISTGGAQGIIGERGRRPTVIANLIADYAAGGMHAAIGILAALLARERTGKGQHVDIAMMDGVVSLMHAEAASYLATGRVPVTGDVLFFGGAPHYNIYETKDGKYISIGALEPWFYENLCKVLGREDFIAHEFTGGEKWEEIASCFREIFLTKTRDEWVNLLRETDTCVAPVYSLDEVFSDPQVIHRKMVVEIDHPTLGKVKQVGISIKLSETPGAIRSIAPRPGEHTEDILKDIGYTQEGIEDLRKSGAIA
ncbi:MAG: CoA transferase [Dehalococcoidia bacterium]|nr:CoA transferase [Dehalococcoidia bacterium]